jgi:hypothetical protein
VLSTTKYTVIIWRMAAFGTLSVLKQLTVFLISSLASRQHGTKQQIRPGISAALSASDTDAGGILR